MYDAPRRFPGVTPVPALLKLWHETVGGSKVEVKLGADFSGLQEGMTDLPFLFAIVLVGVIAVLVCLFLIKNVVFVRLVELVIILQTGRGEKILARWHSHRWSFRMGPSGLGQRLTQTRCGLGVRWALAVDTWSRNGGRILNRPKTAGGSRPPLARDLSFPFPLHNAGNGYGAGVGHDQILARGTPRRGRASGPLFTGPPARGSGPPLGYSWADDSRRVSRRRRFVTYGTAESPVADGCRRRDVPDADHPDAAVRRRWTTSWS